MITIYTKLVLQNVNLLRDLDKNTILQSDRRGNR